MRNFHQMISRFIILVIACLLVTACPPKDRFCTRHPNFPACQQDAGQCVDLGASCNEDTGPQCCGTPDVVQCSRGVCTLVPDASTDCVPIGDVCTPESSTCCAPGPFDPPGVCEINSEGDGYVCNPAP